MDVVWFSDGKEGESFKRLTEKYTETHPDIQFEMIEVPYSELENKLKNMVNADEQPALTRLANIGTFQNQLLDLSEYIDADAFRNNFGSGLQYEFDGKILGAPMDITANGLVYNKTAFEQAGVSVPKSEDEVWTWDEFEDALKTVMANSDCKYGMVVDLSPQRFTTLMYEAGGSMLTEDLSASNFKSEGVKRSVEWFKHLHDEGIIPTSVWLGSENPNEMFEPVRLRLILRKLDFPKIQREVLRRTLICFYRGTDIVNIGLHFFLKNVRPYAASCSEA